MKLFFAFVAAGLLVVASCVKEKSCEGCSQSNQPPLADAGPDTVIILPADSILLDGSASACADGSIVEWKWKKLSGPASFAMVNASAPRTMVRSLLAGVYRFELLVKSDRGLWAKDTVQVTVNEAIQNNRPPVANAGADKIIVLPVNYTGLDGSASTDPDNNIVSYQWTKISCLSLFRIINANAVITGVDDLSAGVYEFELKVTDAAGLSDKDTVWVYVFEEPVQDNVFFYCPDPTGTLGYVWQYWDNGDPVNGLFNLITIKISNLSGILAGVWCKNGCSPRCPIETDYNVEPGNTASFALPPGTYNWTAENTITNFDGWPQVTPQFGAFFSTVHKSQGTITVTSDNRCNIVAINF